MKLDLRKKKATVNESLPVRGAWIEISATKKIPLAGHRRSPCGELGLKFRPWGCDAKESIVAPRAGSVD